MKYRDLPGWPDVLALCLVVFLFWDDADGRDNWDRLDVIIHAHYLEAVFDQRRGYARDDD